MNPEYNQKENETDYEYGLRLISTKVEEKPDDLDWEDIVMLLDLDCHRDSLRKAAATTPYSGYNVAQYYKEKLAQGKCADTETYFKELDEKKRELIKERKKLATEKVEYNRWLTENARDELITEKICGAIANLPPLEIPPYIAPTHSNESYLLCFGDCHYGIEFSIKDLFGNIINEYSPEIFEERMWDMLNQIVEIVNDRGIEELTIFELGDGIQGVLRLNSQLMKLRYGIIDSSILYANFLAGWLNELSQHVRINFHMVIDSNHNQLRICGAQKNAFAEENMSKVMLTLIKERLKNNQNIVIVENPTGMNFRLMSTYSVLGIHGETKDLAKSLNDFSRSLQCPLDYIVGAHCHHVTEKETGMRSEALSIRSVIGVDPYGMSLNRTSDAGASLFVFDQLKGLTCEYKLKLN